MACCLFSVMPLFKPMWSYCQLENSTFSFKKMHLKMSAKWRPFCLGLNVLPEGSSCKYPTLLHTGLLAGHWAVLDSFTISSHNLNGRYLPAILAVQGPLKNSGNSNQPREPTMHCHWGNPQLHLDKPITKGWWQTIRSCLTPHRQSYCLKARIMYYKSRFAKTGQSIQIANK